MKDKMARIAFLCASAGFIFALAACNESLMVEPVGSNGSEELELLHKNSHISANGPGGLTVMTRNVYVGGNVDQVIAAAPADVPLAVANVFQQVVSTNFAERAEAFANEIQSTRPHLIGLQEISVIRIQSPGDLVFGGTSAAETIFLDQLAVLAQALESRGLSYRVVGAVENIDLEVPMITGIDPLSFDDVRLTDYDVLLARGDVKTSDVETVNYAASLPIPGLGSLSRGYVAADATVSGRTFRVITTHLEPVAFPEILPVQLGQIAQLISATQGHSVPVVVMGDLNTGPGDPGYASLIDGGLIDLWNTREGANGSDGSTCCFPDDLRGNSRIPDLRIDLILYRSANSSHGNDGLGSVFMDLVGNDPGDVTPSGLWPSDHVGVVGSLRAPMSAWRIDR